MVQFVMRVVEVPGVLMVAGDPTGMFVVDCDVDAYDGRGDAALTDDVYAARRFDTPGDAMTFYTRTSTVRPFRPDGHPNRPLTAFTVEVLALPQKPENN
jgi:hypothetical protein